MKNILLFLILLLLNQTSFSQQKTVDSLIYLLNRPEDEIKVSILNQIADTYNYINTTKALEYGNQALQLALKINDQTGIAEGYGNLGYTYINLDNETAIKYTQKALSIRKQIKDKIGTASSLNVLGIIYYYQAEYLRSIDYHLQALKLREEIGDKTRIATSYNNIGLVYMALGEYDTSLNYLQKSLAVRMATGNKRGIGIIKDNIGDIYRLKKNYDRALMEYRESLKINREIGNTKSEANSLANIGRLYIDMQQYEPALKFMNESLNLYREYDDYLGIANSETRIAQILLEQNKIIPAVEHALKSLNQARTIKSLENVAISSNILQEGYHRMGDFEKAYKYLVINQNVKDSLKSDDKFKRISKLELNYKIDKMKQEQLAEINKQKLYNYIWGILAFSILIIAVLIFREYLTKKKTNKQLKDLNEKLSELNTKKNKLFSIIGHDLKNPFNAIINSSRELTENYDRYTKAEQLEMMSIITKSSEAAHNLLENLLLWARSQMESISIKQKCFYVKDALIESISVLSHQALSKQIRIISEINESTTVYSDYFTLCTVFRNLLSNAVKFSYSGGQVIIREEQINGSLILSFHDNGTGMSEEDQENIFRIDSIAKRKGTAGESGTGLGLLICKEFVEANGGKLSFESKLNQGSTFRIILPVKNH